MVEPEVLAEQLRMVDECLRLAGYEGGPRRELMTALVAELLSLRIEGAS